MTYDPNQPTPAPDPNETDDQRREREEREQREGRDAEGDKGDGPSSHETSGQFPADEVASTHDHPEQNQPEQNQ